MLKPDRRTQKSGKAPRGRPVMTASKRDEMRADIGAVAEHLFQTEGYATISMRRIAKEVGCTPMALYSYCDGKFDILRMLWSGVFDTVFEKIADVEAIESGLDYLIAISDAYLGYWTDNPSHYRLVFMTEGVTQPDVAGFLDSQKTAEKFSVFAEAIRAASEREPDPKTLKLQLDLLICLLHGIAHNLITITGYDWSASGKLVELGVRSVIRSDAGRLD